MGKGPPAGWRKRKEPIADDHVMASIRQADGKYDPATGFYATIIMRLAPDEDAKIWHNALRNSARHLHRWGKANIGIHVKIKQDRKGQFIEYVAINKTHTYKYMLDRYGPDRRKWPYDPRRINAQ